MHKKTFSIGSTTFLQIAGGPAFYSEPMQDHFYLAKTDDQLAFYEELLEYRPKRIMQIGVYEGGSLVYFDKIFKPHLIMGVDFQRRRVEALVRYCANRPHIRSIFSADQESSEIREAAVVNFPDGIDLVVDDASHQYSQTRSVFESLFPLLRPGGHYVIEGWAWSLQASFQIEQAPWYNKPALANLIFEIVMLSSERTLVERIDVRADLVCVRRGRGIPTPGFLCPTSRLRGRDLQLI